MTLADAIEMMRDGQAAKRPSWGGYVQKVVLTTDATTGEETSYNLVFVSRNATSAQVAAATATTNPQTSTVAGTDNTAGTTDDIGAFIINYNASTTGFWTMPTTNLAIDPILWDGLVANDWTLDTAAACELARSGTDRRW